MRRKILLFAVIATTTLALLGAVERWTRPEMADEYDA